MPERKKAIRTIPNNMIFMIACSDSGENENNHKNDM